MKKVVILGCENSHAINFLDSFTQSEEFSDVSVVGVYSDEPEAAANLHEKYGVRIMNDYAELAGSGELDGVIITARHGANHYKYAKPYIKDHIPMFIDKPITVDGAEALEFMRELRDNGIRICGGSSLVYDPAMDVLKEENANDVKGKTIGGIVRAPLDENPKYGGFYFYAQHLVEMICDVFGRNAESVSAYRCETGVTALIAYPEYFVTAAFMSNNAYYTVLRFSKKGNSFAEIPNSTNALRLHKEISGFHDLLCGKPQKKTYDDFITPVFIMNAIYESLENGGKMTKICKERV